MKLNLKSLCTILLSSTILYSHAASADKVSDIVINGNHRVEKDTILNYLTLKKGEEYSEGKERESIKDLYNTNLFDDIKIKFNKGLVEVDIKETPLVTKVELQGNSRIKSSIIKKELIAHKGSFLNKSDIKADVAKIKELYRKSGRYAVSVNAKIKELDSKRATVTYQIAEGPKSSIKYINFVGNRNYKDSELKSVLITKESAWFRFLDTSDTYDPDRVDYDKFLLEKFYHSLGYADFRVISSSAQLSETKEYFTLTYTVEEGGLYKFGNISIESKVDAIDPNLFEKLISIKEGEKYNGSKLEKISEEINEKLADLGFTGAIIYPDEKKNSDTKIVDIKFIVEKGSKTYIDKIIINGNLKTRDNVIRRQLKLNEGDLFNRSAIQKGEQNLRNLDYFEKVNLEIEPSANGNNKANVKIDVEEKSTSSIQFEVGWNSIDGPVGRINFVERNLLGTGRYLTAGIDKYERKTSYNVGVTDPYFMDRDLLVGVKFFDSESKGNSSTPYSQQTIAGTTQLGYEVTTDLRHDIAYMYKADKLYVANRYSPSIFIQEEFGKTNTSSVANSLTYDKTDSVVVPKNGYILSATETYAGVGGDKKYLKHEADFKLFKSFYNNDFTLKISGDAGKVHGIQKHKLGITDRYSLGDYSFRGFAPGGLGPRDTSKGDIKGEGLGGKNFYTLSTELFFQIGFPKEFNVQGSVFCELGSLWGYDIKTPHLYNRDKVLDSTTPRVTVGAGIIWITRIAPISIYYGLPIKREKWDKTQPWSFRFSTSF